MVNYQALNRFIALFLFLLQSAALATRSAAEDEFPAGSDKVLSYEDVAELTSSGTLTFQGLGKAEYTDSGKYSFTQEGFTKKGSSVTRLGFFDIKKDGKVCVDFFRGERGRCHIFVRRNGIVFMLTEEGDRFPVTFNINGF